MVEKLKLLLQILSDGKYHSGTALGQILKLTRGGIWEIIQQAKRYGIIVEAKTNLGYRILGGFELLDKNIIAKYLKKRRDFTAKEILVFDELPSTSTYLAELVKTSLSKKNACYAEYQTQGRGRLGRAWCSPFGKNIYLSLSWPFSCEPHELSCLGLVMAIATANALKSYGINRGLSLKWPNDVLWEKRKLAGILVDLFGESHYTYMAILSVGLNVNMPKEVGETIGQPWCDIEQIIGKVPERNKLAGLLLDNILSVINVYQKRGFKPFIERWQRLDATCGKKITLITPRRKLTGLSCGIDDKGYLLVKDNKGQISAHASGEISLRF